MLPADLCWLYVCIAGAVHLPELGEQPGGWAVIPGHAACPQHSRQLRCVCGELLLLGLYFGHLRCWQRGICLMDRWPANCRTLVQVKLGGHICACTWVFQLLLWGVNQAPVLLFGHNPSDVHRYQAPQPAGTVLLQALACRSSMLLLPCSWRVGWWKPSGSRCLISEPCW